MVDRSSSSEPEAGFTQVVCFPRWLGPLEVTEHANDNSVGSNIPDRRKTFVDIERIPLSMESDLTWINIPSTTLLTESGSLSLVETSCGPPEIRRGSICSLLRKACLLDESLDSFLA